MITKETFKKVENYIETKKPYYKFLLTKKNIKQLKELDLAINSRTYKIASELKFLEYKIRHAKSKEKKWNICLNFFVQSNQRDREKLDKFKKELREHISKYFNTSILIDICGYDPWQEFEFRIYVDQNEKITFPEFNGKIELKEIKIKLKENECSNKELHSTFQINLIKKFIKWIPE